MTPLLAAALAATVVTSLVTAVLFALDKSRARRGRRRIPEGVLLAWALAGGWPGALAARRFWCHKTVKQPFSTWLWLITGVHLGVWLIVCVRS